MFDRNLISNKYLNPNDYLDSFKVNFLNAKPFPSIVIKDFFEDSFLSKVLEDFPDLEKIESSQKYNNQNEFKFASNDYNNFPNSIKKLVDFLNSKSFLNFIQKITSIEEKLISDEELNGGGLHEIKQGGVLKIHTDFNKHPNNNLDRRVNLLLYLNKNWKDSYGGFLELWDKNMKNCFNKIKPEFNTMVIFNTNDYSNHGHPDPLNCPLDRSRKSIATYYFSDGRPSYEIDDAKFKNKTYFKSRDGIANDAEIDKQVFKNFLRKQKIYQLIKKLEKKFLRRNKKKIK